MTIGLSDISSRVLANHILPEELVEPVILIAKIKGFRSVDEYFVDLIEDDLISVKEGGQGFRELGEKIAEYLDKNEYLEKLYPSDLNKESVKDHVRVKMDSDLVDRFNKIEERKKQKQQLEKESKSNNDDGYKKFIKDVNKSTAIIEFPSKEEVENRFGKVPPDDDNDKEKEELK